MSNIAAALPIPANTSAIDSATGLAPPGAASDAAVDDFVLALTQALSAAVSPEAMTHTVGVIVPATPLATEAASEDEPTTEELAASFAGLLSLPLFAPSTVPLVGNQVDPLESLGVSGNAARPGDSQSLSLTTALMQPFATANAASAALDETPPEAPTSQLDAGLLLAPAIDKPSQTPQLASEAGAASAPLHSSVGTQAWHEELGTRVTVMAARGQHSASLRLSPEHLGPLEIRISIRDDQASVWFGAAHADTRAAIEHALPRLREMFAAQGMSLTDAGVSREPPREQSTPRQSAFAEPANETPVTLATLQRVGLIDAYA
jgi:flagellar hook-length control protein FliK